MSKTRAPSRGLKHPGSLTRLGYHEHESAAVRRRALGKAVKRYGYKKTADKLINAQVLNKNQNPEFSRVAKEDRAWMRTEYRGSGSIRSR